MGCHIDRPVKIREETTLRSRQLIVGKKRRVRAKEMGRKCP